MVLLGDLVSTAGSALAVVGPFDATREITGVHVSELADPGRYLVGGEMLLTTGIPLGEGRRNDEYVRRLATHSVGALGVGLGEGWDALPPGLARLCADAGVALFVVPDGEPFLSVSRAFATILGRGDRAAAVRTGHAHTRLAEAAAAPEPVPEIVREVAEATGGWAAWLPLSARAPNAVVHPPSLTGLLQAVRVDVERSITRSGVAAASFVAHGSSIVAHPVAAGARTWGALVIGASRPFSRSDRQLTMNAVALLRQAVARPSGAADVAGLIAALALDGDARSARALARLTGVGVPDIARVVVTDDDAELSATDLRIERDGLTIGLLDAHRPARVPHGVISEPVALEDAAVAASRSVAAWLAVGPEGPRDPVRGTDAAATWATALAAAGLDEVVRAHLGGGQRIERTADALGVHRNTMRSRLAAAERVIGRELSDPDVAAELWLRLRRI